MTDFNDMLAADAANVFTNEFAEDLEYYPKGRGMRQIRGVVDRSPPRPISEVKTQPGVMTDEFMVEVANSSTTGIATSELDTGSDTIGIGRRHGDAVLKIYRIIGVLKQDAGMLMLRCR